jgi:hypothetical protein
MANSSRARRPDCALTRRPHDLLGTIEGHRIASFAGRNAAGTRDVGLLAIQKVVSWSPSSGWKRLAACRYPRPARSRRAAPGWTRGRSSSCGMRRPPYLPCMANVSDRVHERRRAVQLARHYREAEGLSIAQIAQRLGRSPATIKAYFYGPTCEKARAVKTRYQGICRGCGAPTQPRNGKGDAYGYCKRCHPGAIAPKWTRQRACATRCAPGGTGTANRPRRMTGRAPTRAGEAVRRSSAWLKATGPPAPPSPTSTKDGRPHAPTRSSLGHHHCSRGACCGRQNDARTVPAPACDRRMSVPSPARCAGRARSCGAGRSGRPCSG